MTWALLRAYLRARRRQLGVIPEKADQVANRKKRGRRCGRPVAHDAVLYRERNMAERLLASRPSLSD